MTEARVPVTDDVAAAKAMLEHAFRHVGTRALRDVAFSDIVQHFTAHRLAGVAAGREEACQAIEHRICEGYDVPARKADQCVHGKFGWEDCIACYDDALEGTLSAIRQMGGE